jgi:flagellar biosynthetic protein FliP
VTGRLALLLTGLAILAGTFFLAGPAVAAGPLASVPAGPVTSVPAGPVTSVPAGPLAAPVAPVAPASPTPPTGVVNIDIGGGSKPSQPIVILLGLTILSVAPALLLLCTSFTKIFVVLSITRNALCLTSVPPNQVLAGLALFLSLFIMGPVVSAINAQGVQPYIKGDKSQSQAFTDGVKPLHAFMIKQTRNEEIALFTKVSKSEKPKNAESVPLSTLVPAFALSELRAAFIIGFVIFIPFLVIDMVVSASLMSMGMMMLPPVSVALPFKLLLFVMANGWGLIVTSLVASYN